MRRATCSGKRRARAHSSEPLEKTANSGWHCNDEPVASTSVQSNKPVQNPFFDYDTGCLMSPSASYEKDNTSEDETSASVQEEQLIEDGTSSSEKEDTAEVEASPGSGKKDATEVDAAVSCEEEEYEDQLSASPAEWREFTYCDIQDEIFGVAVMTLETAPQTVRWLKASIPTATRIKVFPMCRSTIIRPYMRRIHRLSCNLNRFGGKMEQRLWHGTTREKARSICRSGFDPELCERSCFGLGTYFAADPAYAANFSCKEPTSGLQYLILASVITGNYCIGSSMKRVQRGYHSAADSIEQPSEFVVSDRRNMLALCVVEFAIP